MNPPRNQSAPPAWQAKRVYAMAVICLVVGLAIGHLFRGSQSPVALAPPVASAKPSAPAGGMGGHTPSLEEMKQMADKKAAPLLEKLKGKATVQKLMADAQMQGKS